MTDLYTLETNLVSRGFLFRFFETAAEAAQHLNAAIHGRTVGIGGSKTIKDMGLYDMLRTHNQVFDHWRGDTVQTFATEVYLTSVNAIAETGELVNIDGRGNRVSSSVFGHKKVYFIAGINKVMPDFESALSRARNIAAPKRAQQYGCKTPCAAKADRCYDCQSSDRLCCSLMVYWKRSMGIEEAEVILIKQALGL